MGNSFELDTAAKVILTSTNLPYTTTKAGVLCISLQPNANAYAYLGVTSSVLSYLRESTYNGANGLGTVHVGTHIIPKGDTLSAYVATGCSTASKIEFIPFK